MHAIARDTMVDGRYRAQKRLGSGGMAVVWCAEDEVLGRRVALKLLGARYADDAEFRERFRREAQSAAGLTHPNIVAIFDRSDWDGTPYIAMELVDGRTLKEIVTQRGPLDPGTATDVMIQVLGALGYAHRRGLVHRDVKPQNVIIDGEGQAKVADFGIARAVGASEMTETGAIVGTVQYLSPEQAQGRPVDRRSDLYSAGVVLYELLTGRVPFDAEAAVSVALKHVSERPVPPSQLRPGLPPALEAVVMRALEKDPARRYQSAEEFVSALQHARRMPARPAVPVGPSPGEPWVEEAASRSRWWVWLLVLVVLAAAGAGAYYLVAGRRVDVPKVTGQSSDVAVDRLHRAGLEVAIVSRSSERVARDRVIAQDPGAGARAKEGSTVDLVVSAGRGKAPVPDVDGQGRDAASAAVKAAGFKVAVRQAFSADVKSGTVVSASPAAGTPYTKGRTVTLTVSRGPQGIAVPKVVGLQRAEAERQLEAVGLQAKVVEKETTQPAGTVMQQDPVTGTPLAKGAAVTLTVAKARPEVPDVTTGNPAVADATKTLEDAGFKVVTRPRAGDPALAGKVVAQSPAPGERRSTGATVTVTVGADAAAAPTPTPTPVP